MKRQAEIDSLPHLAFVRATPAVTYSFRRADGRWGDWALCTVNDATGELNVQSDWGNWSYRWDIRSLGVAATLTEFLGDGSSAQYLADKLTSDHENTNERPAKYEFDAALTVRELRRAAGESYRDRRIDKETCRRFCEELDELTDARTSDDFLQRYYEIAGWHKVDECPWDGSLQHQETRAYLYLRYRVLPQLIAACRAAAHDRHSYMRMAWTIAPAEVTP